MVLRAGEVSDRAVGLGAGEPHGEHEALALARRDLWGPRHALGQLRQKRGRHQPATAAACVRTAVRGGGGGTGWAAWRFSTPAEKAAKRPARGSKQPARSVSTPAPR
jgi:hypothetical protein